MDTWETIRLRCRRDGEKIKVVARDLDLAPNTVRKYLRHDGPPKSTLKPRAKLLDPYMHQIDELIRTTPKITAVRIGSWLRQNVDPLLEVDERTLRVYVAARRDTRTAGSVCASMLRSWRAVTIRLLADVSVDRRRLGRRAAVCVATEL
jgi:hypothetical protein